MSETTECGFLRLPNDWIDRAMPTMTPAEWMIATVILRQTIGWHKQRDAISLTQFQQRSGLARHTCIKAIRGLATKRWIRAYEHGGGTLYELSFEDGAETAPVPASAESALPLVQKLHQPSAESAPKLVQKLHTQKKGKTLNKRQGKKTYIGASARDVVPVTESIPSVVVEATTQPEIDWFADDPPAAAPAAAEPEIDWFADDPVPVEPPAAAPTPAPAPAATESSETLKRVRKAKRALSDHEAQRHQELFSGIARICVLDPKLKSCAGQIARTAKELREADSSATDATMTEFLEWWKTADFRGKMGKPPTPQQVVQTWRQFREGYAERPAPLIGKQKMSMSDIMSALAEVK